MFLECFLVVAFVIGVLTGGCCVWCCWVPRQLSRVEALQPALIGPQSFPGLLHGKEKILPTDAELGALDSVERVCRWSGLPEGVWRQFSNTLGGCTQLRVLATLPQQTLQDATSST